MGQKRETFSRREREIMNILFQREEASAADIQANLANPPSYSATRALLAVLVDKGHVTYRREGPKYIYRPTHSKAAAGTSALRGVLATFFGGSVSQAVAGLLESSDQNLPPEEIERLRRILEEANGTGSQE